MELTPSAFTALTLGMKASHDLWLTNIIEEYEANTTAMRIAMTIIPFHTPPVSSLPGVGNCSSNAACNQNKYVRKSLVNHATAKFIQ